MTAWTMPPELEPYRDLITNISGNDVERLMNIYTADEETGARYMKTNLPVYLMAAMCGAQIALLRQLHAKQLLANPADVNGLDITDGVVE